MRIQQGEGARQAIRQLKDLLFSALAKIADAVGEIIAHPIRFLQGFVGAVKDGVQRFGDKVERAPPGVGGA